MKKLIVITALFLLITALAAGEIYIDTTRYTAVENKLAALSGAIEISGGAGFSDDIKRLYRDVYDEWERYDDLFLVFTNHNVIRSLGEKFIYLGAYIDADAYSDAYSTAKAIAGVIKEVKREKYPLLGNIF